MEYKTLLKRLVLFIIALVILIFLGKLFMFYIPFLIAYIISLLVDPIIKYINKKTNLTRKTSSIIVLATFFVLLMLVVSWGIVKLVSESTNLLGALNSYFEIIIDWSNEILEKIDMSKISVADDIKEQISSTSSEILDKIMGIITYILNSFLEYLKSIPTLIIYSVITVLATYFITSDKFYILDRLEHHIPKKILGKINIKLEKIVKSLGEYLKAEMIMIGISFIIVLMGLNIFYLMGMKVGYPLIMALFIGFVDLLPILGAGTVMIPWSIMLLIGKEYSVGFSILGLYILVLAIRQFLEPKIISNKIGVHPIFTLISMYTGFKCIGIIGMLVGPIILIILKNVFENMLNKGIIKSFFEE